MQQQQIQQQQIQQQQLLQQQQQQQQLQQMQQQLQLQQQQQQQQQAFAAAQQAAAFGANHSLQLPGGGGLASLNSLILMDNPSDELIQQRLMVSSESFKAMGIAMDTPSEQDRISQAIGADLGAALALTSLSPNNSLGLMSDAGDPASAGQGN